MVDEFVIARLSKLFTVIANEIRIKIIYTLMEYDSLSVTEISQKIGIPQNTLSSHLKILYDGGYITKAQNWRTILYKIKEPKLREILELGSMILYNKWEGSWEKIAFAKKKIEEINKRSKDEQKK
ncbi:MAG: winged helix-turn-helix transcriptional regulator [Candidatus Cloacimonetes bacterium]|nr:winged helix-turn-helix transcriptional regulator [Candidatus Cloacimonadota bacterium]